MNDQETIQDYCYDEAAFDYHDRAYIPLQVQTHQTASAVPEILKPDQKLLLMFTIRSPANRRCSAPARQKDRNWGYNGPLLNRHL